MSDQPNPDRDNMLLIAFSSLILFIIAYVVWFMFSEQIKSGVRWVRYGEMQVIEKIMGPDYIPPNGMQGVDISTMGDQVKKWQPTKSAADIEALAIMTHYSVSHLLIPFTVIYGIFIALVVTGAPGTKYRRKLTLDSLIKVQSQNFPVIKPFVDFNPSDQPFRAPGSPVPAELPLFAEALGPEEWIAYHQIPMPDGMIDETTTRKAFIKQLIGRWQGPTKLEPYQQVMLAAFCLKAARQRAKADELLSRLAGCWDYKKGLKFSQDKKLLRTARSILKNKEIAGPTLKLLKQHAYVTTALMRALDYARSEGGVLAPAQFVWLRGYNRDLWYPLNNLGRQSYHMEAMGATAHYKAEKRSGRPIPRPKVEDGIQTITEYMASDKVRPVPPLDYGAKGPPKNHKQGIKKPKSGVKMPKVASA